MESVRVPKNICLRIWIEGNTLVRKNIGINTNEVGHTEILLPHPDVLVVFRVVLKVERFKRCLIITSCRVTEESARYEVLYRVILRNLNGDILGLNGEVPISRTDFLTDERLGIRVHRTVVEPLKDGLVVI